MHVALVLRRGSGVYCVPVIMARGGPGAYGVLLFIPQVTTVQIEVGHFNEN